MTSAIPSTKCRVCICALDAAVCSYDMQQLPDLAHKFATLTDLSLSQSESEQEQQLPSELCQACFEQLEESYAFRSKCIAADAQWRLDLSSNIPSEDIEKNPGTTEALHELANEETEIELPQVESVVENEIVAVEISGAQVRPIIICETFTKHLIFRTCHHRIQIRATFVACVSRRSIA